jgi:hypothetical protein
MYQHLRKYYPELEMGTYTHIVHSLHIYERHFDLIKDMLDQPFEPMSFPDMREFIIDPEGNPLDCIKYIETAIVNGGDIPVHDDPLHDWITNAIFSDI